MPDQNSAAAEHALIQEIIEPLSTLPDDPVAIAADRDFPLVLRGYDRIAVDAYVAKTSQLIAELQATRSPEAAVRRALERVGEEVSSVLQRAHETADQITERSRAESEERLQKSRIEADEIKAGAVQSLKDLDAETDRIWAERQRIVEDIEELSRRLLGLAESAIDRFPPEEQATKDAQDADRAPDEAAEGDEEAPEAQTAPEWDGEDESGPTAVMAPLSAERATGRQPPS
jgi:hypothetical protein